MNLQGRTVAITGATGFLGRYLAERLKARGARVVAVVRNPDKASVLATRGCEIRKADLADPAALERAFQGAFAVISNAAVVGWINPDETRRTNVEGTRNVFMALAHAGVRRAIAISSASAYPRSLFTLDERTPLRRSERWDMLHAYGESKAKGERVAWEICEQHGVGLTTFRPCGITGPDDPLLMGVLRSFMRLPIVPFPVLSTIGVVHAEDVAEAVALALERPEASVGRAYNLQGSTASLWSLGSAFRRAGGKAPWLRLPVPFPYVLRFDDQRARRELGWEPRGVDEIMKEAVPEGRA